MKRIAVIITLLALPQITLGEPTWLAFLPEYPEGTAPITNVLVSDENHTVVELRTPGAWVDNVEYEGITYQYLTIPDCQHEDIAGNPALPHVVNTVAVPGEKEVTLNIIEKNTATLEDYVIWPAHFPRTWDEPERPFYKNDFAYTWDGDYPYFDAGLGARRYGATCVLSILSSSPSNSTPRLVP